MDTAAIPGIYILYPIDICICNPPLIHLSDFNSLITCSTEGKLQKAAHSSQAWWENHISDSLYLAYICLIFLIMVFFFWFRFQGLPLIWTGIYVVMSILLYRYRFSCPEKNPLEHPSKVASTLQKIRDSSIWLTLFSSVFPPSSSLNFNQWNYDPVT